MFEVGNSLFSMRSHLSYGAPRPVGPPLHNPFFGGLAKAMRPEQAIVLLDGRGFDANATDAVRNAIKLKFQMRTSIGEGGG